MPNQMIDSRDLYQQTEAARRAEFIAGIRAFADFLEQNENVQIPVSLTANVYATNDQARTIRRGTYGWQKESDPSSAYFVYSKSFTESDLFESWEGVQYVVTVSKKDTCERVRVGVQHVEAHDVPVYEWRCE
jgi:hypothetical protein